MRRCNFARQLEGVDAGLGVRAGQQGVEMGLQRHPGSPQGARGPPRWLGRLPAGGKEATWAVTVSMIMRFSLRVKRAGGGASGSRVAWG